MVRWNELIAVEWLSTKHPDWKWVAEALSKAGSNTDPRSAPEKVAHLHLTNNRSIFVVQTVHTAAPVIDFRKVFGLTPREAEVAHLLLERRTNKEIAASLGVTQHTAWRHTEKVIAKSGCGSRRNLPSVVRQKAAEAGLTGDKRS